MKTNLIILTVIYTLIFQVACKNIQDSNVQEINPNSWFNLVPMDEVHMRKQLMNIRKALFEVESNIPVVAYNKTRNTMTEIKAADVESRANEDGHEELFFGSSKTRYLYSIKPIEAFERNASRGKFKFQVVEHDRQNDLMESDINLLVFDLSNSKSSSSRAIRATLTESMRKLNYSIKDTPMATKDQFNWRTLDQNDLAPSRLSENERRLKQLNRQANELYPELGPLEKQNVVSRLFMSFVAVLLSSPFWGTVALIPVELAIFAGAGPDAQFAIFLAITAAVFIGVYLYMKKNEENTEKYRKTKIEIQKLEKQVEKEKRLRPLIGSIEADIMRMNIGQ